MRVLMVFVFLLLNGCANWLNNTTNSHTPTDGYVTYNQINYTEVVSENEIAFSINEKSPTFKFDQGISYFHAIKLSGTNRQFLLRSFFSDTKITRFASPVLLELDNEFNVVSTLEPLLVYSESPRYEIPHMQGIVSLNEKTKYLIVYPSNDEQSPRTRTEVIDPQTNGNKAQGVVLFPEYQLKQLLTKTKTGKIELIPTTFSS